MRCASRQSRSCCQMYDVHNDVQWSMPRGTFLGTKLLIRGKRRWSAIAWSCMVWCVACVKCVNEGGLSVGRVCTDQHTSVCELVRIIEEEPEMREPQKKKRKPGESSHAIFQWCWAVWHQCVMAESIEKLANIRSATSSIFGKKQLLWCMKRCTILTGVRLVLGIKGRRFLKK